MQHGKSGTIVSSFASSRIRVFAYSFLLITGYCLLIASPAQAADTKDFFQAMGYESSGGNVLDVEINKGVSVRLGTPAASVAVADPEIADVQALSPRMLFINGRGVGETSIIAVDAQDNIIYESTVNVTHNLSRLKRAVAEMSPDSSITADSTDNAIILKGKADSPVTAEKVQRLATRFLRGEGQSIINMMDTSGSDQVMLRVKIVEVARAELKRLGINWESVLNSGNFVFGLANGRDIVDGAGNFTRNIAGDSSLGVGYRQGGRNINALIDALEDDGLVSILAEPNLTTRSGQPASFLAGGEYPIPVPAEDGAVAIEYRQFGVSLCSRHRVRLGANFVFTYKWVCPKPFLKAVFTQLRRSRTAGLTVPLTI